MKGQICSSLDDLIGNTPLMEFLALERKLDLHAHIHGKLEYFNPAGSIKDRIAMSMLNDAEKKGLLKPGGTIIEPTSGNTGIGLAAEAAARGYRLIITMPENMSVERRLQMEAFGADIVLTPVDKGITGAIARAKEIHESIPGSIIVGQFTNQANPAIHRETTGPEIWRDTEGRIDFLVAGVGTGGTITGIGEYLKEKDPSIKIVAVEPASSPILSGGKAGVHKIQGIGAGFVPEILNTSIYDEVIPVQNEDAFEASRLLARTEGILVGISSGAAIQASVELSKRPENAGKVIVAILPDSGLRYLTTDLFRTSAENN